MSNKIPEMSDEKGVVLAAEALIAIDESIAKLEYNRQLLTSVLNKDRGDDVDNVVVTIRDEIKEVCSRIPTDLPEDEACDWLRDALLQIIYNNT